MVVSNDNYQGFEPSIDTIDIVGLDHYVDSITSVVVNGEEVENFIYFNGRLKVRPENINLIEGFQMSYS